MTGPLRLSYRASRESILAALQGRRLDIAELLEDDGSLRALVTREELATPQPDKPNLVVIMAGGRGTRLLPITEDRLPKPMVDIGGRPILETIIEQLAGYGLRRIVLAVNHMAGTIRDYFEDGSRLGVRIDYIEEEEPLGTVGAVGLLPCPETRPVIVMNGDLLTRVNFDALLADHEAAGDSLTMCVRRHEVQVPYGVVDVGGDGRVRGLREKPILSHHINAGIYALGTRALAMVPRGRRQDITELAARLLEDGQRVGSFQLVEYWSDIGTPTDYHEAHRAYGEHFGQNPRG